MKFGRAITLLFTLLVITAHRLPAPIRETPESPTPAAAERAKPSKPVPKAKVTEPERKINSTVTPAKASRPQGLGRFAGNWTGTINQGALGDVSVSLNINATGTSVQEVNRTGTFTHPATIGGNAMTWKSGWLSDISWTLVPNGDGKTAAVTARSGFGVNGSATFRRQ